MRVPRLPSLQIRLNGSRRVAAPDVRSRKSTLLVWLIVAVTGLLAATATAKSVGVADIGTAPTNAGTGGAHKLANVFGDDDRRLMRPAEAGKFRSIGIIRCADGGIGTAFLVTVEEQVKDVIVTAAHTLIGKKGKRRPTCKFYPAGDPSRRQSAGVVRYVAGTHDPYKRILDGKDWAVATIVKRLSKTYGALPVAALAPALGMTAPTGEFSMVGFDGDSRRLMITDNCKVFAYEDTNFRNYDPLTMFEHNCDSTQGWSGSPFMVKRAQGYVAVGVHSGEIRGLRADPRFTPNLVVRFDAAIIAAIKTLAAK